MNRLLSCAPLIATAIALNFLKCTTSWGLSSCEVERPSEVVTFTRGTATPALPLDSDNSDPEILLRSTSTSESLTLGLGGSLIVKFTVPIANYPAAGSLMVERPQDALPCSSYPVQAEISGSIDGVHFVPLGTTCQSAAFDLGAFSWIAYLRITDVTDPSDPAFGSQPIHGFDLRAAFGPGCLKYAHCAVPATPDSSVTSNQEDYALSLSHFSDDFVLSDGASFEEYGNGTARLLGNVYRKSDPTAIYTMIVSLTGRVLSPPLNSPVLALNSNAYASQGGSVDPSSWYYYKRLSGIILGIGSLAGEEITLRDTINAAQIGGGANGRNTSFGASGSFTYGALSSSYIGNLKIGLSSCSALPPSPTPSTTPLPTPLPTPLVTPEVTPQVTPEATAQSTPPITPHTATPSGELLGDPPRCEESDLTSKLLVLDNMLFTRLDTINRATRLLVRERRSQRNIRYRARAKAEVQNLYLLAWRAVWRHDRIVQSCSPSSLCFDLHLEPVQAAMAASARVLDSSVENSLTYVKKRLATVKYKRSLRRLSQLHTNHHKTFIEGLSALPEHSTRCRIQGN